MGRSSGADRKGQPQQGGTVHAYEAIKAHILDRIRSGELSTGDRVPSEHQLAESFDVSRGTARQALAELDSEGYLVREPGRGSFVSAPYLRGRAAALAKDVLPAVVCAYPRAAELAETPVLRAILRGFTATVKSRDIHPVFYHLDSDPEGELAFLRSVQDSPALGLALWRHSSAREEQDLLESLVDAGFPVVLFDTRFDAFEIDFAGNANRKAFDRLTTIMVRRGHERVAYAARDFTDSVMRDRFTGFRWAVRKCGLPFGREFIVSMSGDAPDEAVRFDKHAGSASAIVAQEGFAERLREAADMLTREARPTGIVCSDDWTAHQIIQVLEERDMRPGDGFEVACMDDWAEGRDLSNVPWFAATQNGFEIGRHAAELLLERLEQPGRPVQQRFVDSVMFFRQEDTDPRKALARARGEVMAGTK